MLYGPGSRNFVFNTAMSRSASGSAGAEDLRVAACSPNGKDASLNALLLRHSDAEEGRLLDLCFARLPARQRKFDTFKIN